MNDDDDILWSNILSAALSLGLLPGTILFYPFTTHGSSRHPVMWVHQSLYFTAKETEAWEVK